MLVADLAAAPIDWSSVGLFLVMFFAGTALLAAAATAIMGLMAASQTKSQQERRVERRTP
jgi:hypothetical protein